MFWDLFGLIVGIKEPTFFKGRFFFYALIQNHDSNNKI